MRQVFRIFTSFLGNHLRCTALVCAFPRLESAVLDKLSSSLAFVALSARRGDTDSPEVPSADSLLLAFGPPGATDALSGIFPVYDIGDHHAQVCIASNQPNVWAECQNCGKVSLWAKCDDETWWWRHTQESECCKATMTGQEGLRESPKDASGVFARSELHWPRSDGIT